MDGRQNHGGFQKEGAPPRPRNRINLIYDGQEVEPSSLNEVEEVPKEVKNYNASGEEENAVELLKKLNVQPRLWPWMDKRRVMLFYINCFKLCLKKRLNDLTCR